MVEINNQRKAFLDILAWSGGTVTDVRKPEIMVGNRRHLWGELLHWLLRSPSQTCHAKPKTQINRRRTPWLLSRWWDAHTPDSLAWKTSLEKSGRCGIAAADWGVALYYDWSWWLSVEQSTVAAISGLHRALVMVSSSIRLTAWLQNSKKRAERSERLMYEQSHRDYLALVICIIVCLSWAGNHYRDNAITYKASAIRNARELKLAGRSITDMQMRRRDVCCARCVTKELADVNTKMMLCVMMLPLVVVGCTSKQSVDQCVKHTASGVDNQSLPDRGHAERDSPSERLITMQKQLEGNQEVY